MSLMGIAFLLAAMGLGCLIFLDPPANLVFGVFLIVVAFAVQFAGMREKDQGDDV